MGISKAMEASLVSDESRMDHVTPCPWHQDLVQRVDHPRGMWAVAALENGELATGCHDGVIRLFTRDVNKVAPPEVGFHEHMSLTTIFILMPSPICVIQMWVWKIMASCTWVLTWNLWGSGTCR